MKKYLLTLLAGSLISVGMQAQQCFMPDYQELPDPAAVNHTAWEQQADGLHFAWGSTDVRYAKSNVPEGLQSSALCRLSAWKGEKLNAQFVLWSKQEGEITLACTALKNKRGEEIAADCISTGFVRYVMTDELAKNRKTGCGHRPDRTQFDSLLVADAIDCRPSFSLQPRKVCPVWVSVKVPQDIGSGEYEGSISIMNGGKEAGRLRLTVNVGKRTLPAPSDRKFHLDLWQNPYAVARFYGTGEWTKEHFDAMRPVMKALADAGQKVITASIMHKPWNGQTYDYFESMITWMKRYDGTWEFRFDVFDAWVEFMMSLGIDKQINCYSMVPWSLSFRYFDQKTNTMQTLKTEPGKPEYEEVWTALLKSFSKHLKEKGWFEKTCIAMDERPLPVMKKVLETIRKADKDFKVALAGMYYEELEPYIYDYCVSTDQLFPWSVIDRRNSEHKVTTYYTYCADTTPNTFTFSAPAEAAWIGLYAARLHTNGYLRWAYNSWVENPLQDSRFITWAGGDTYLVYPGFRSSIRFERLIEGIQQYEKIMILKSVSPRMDKRMEKLLEEFDLEGLKQGEKPEKAVEKAKKLLNRL